MSLFGPRASVAAPPVESVHRCDGCRHPGGELVDFVLGEFVVQACADPKACRVRAQVRGEWKTL
jgi:hypothetical protein